MLLLFSLVRARLCPRGAPDLLLVCQYRSTALQCYQDDLGPGKHPWYFAKRPSAVADIDIGAIARRSPPRHEPLAIAGNRIGQGECGGPKAKEVYLPAMGMPAQDQVNSRCVLHHGDVWVMCNKKDEVILLRAFKCLFDA